MSVVVTLPARSADELVQHQIQQEPDAAERGSRRFHAPVRAAPRPLGHDRDRSEREHPREQSGRRPLQEHRTENCAGDRQESEDDRDE